MNLKLRLFCLVLLLAGCQPGTGEFSEVEEQEPPVIVGDLLSEIQDTIFNPICSECHIGSQAPLGLRLEDSDLAFEFLVNVAAVGDTSFDRVTPFDSDNSFLFMKVSGDPRAGQRMPLGRAPLNDESIQLIKDWIDQGALPAESSKVLTKVQSVKAIVDHASQFRAEIFNRQYEIRFSQPIDVQYILKNNLTLYQNIQGGAFLVSEADYDLHIVSRQQVNLTITNLQLPIESLSLVINDPSGSGVLDLKGRLLDGDNNQEEGGRYEFRF